MSLHLKSANAEYLQFFIGRGSHCGSDSRMIFFNPGEEKITEFFYK